MKKILILMGFILAFILFSHENVLANSVSSSLNAQFKGSTTAFTLRDLSTGQVVMEQNGQLPLSPASSYKTITAAAALDYLGANFTFHTYLYYSGTITNGVLNGDLYLKGEGDPTLQASDLRHFANVLKRLGIQKINGHILGDDSYFTGAQLSPGVLPSYEGDYYAAPISALNVSVDADYDANSVKVQVLPTKVGSYAKVTILPNTSGLHIINQAKTVARGKGTKISVTRKRGTNQVVISGHVAVGSSSTQLVTVYNATLSTMNAFAEIIKEKGITLAPTSKVTYGVVPENATRIQTKTSIPLKQLMVPFMKLSNNPIADILTKTMGKKVYGVGDLNHGTKAIEQYLLTKNIDLNGWQMVDGSGLSAKDKVTTNQLTQLLVQMPQTENYATYLNALPVGGQSAKFVGGSLKKRFTKASMKNRILAKTGYIPGSYSLSGYVRANSGKWYAFSIITSKAAANPSIDLLMEKVVQTY